MMQFKGFKPEAMKKIQGSLGYQGYPEDFENYLEQNPDKKSMMNSYKEKAVAMMNGGIVMGYANGGTLASNIVPSYGSQMSGPAPGIRTAEMFEAELQQPTGKDADGFFGDPRRLRQDLYFDPATGTYTPFGAMDGPLIQADPSYQVGGAGPNGPNMGGPSGQLPGMGANFNSQMPNISTGMFAGQQPTGPLPARNRASYDKAAAESAAQRAGGFLGRVVLPGEESFEDYMAFGPLIQADPNQTRPTRDDTEQNLITDNFMGLPGMGMNPRTQLPPQQGIGAIGNLLTEPPAPDYASMPQRSDVDIKADYVRAQTEAKELRDSGRLGQPDGYSPIRGEESFEEFVKKYNVNKVPYPKPLTIDPRGGQGDLQLGTLETESRMQQDPRVIGGATMQSTSTDSGPTQITDIVANNALNPMLPEGGVVKPVGTEITAGQMQNPNVGQLDGMGNAGTIIAGTNAAGQPTQTAANTMEATQAADAVAAATDDISAAQGTVSDPAKVTAATDTTSSVSDLTAAQGTGVLMQNPTQRKIETGELISGAANAETASKFAEELQAAQANPTKAATVQGQLENLMTDFEGGATPPWAAGAMRAISAQMAARGLGASSMAGQAMVQGAMESALPIAVADAKTQATFESQNLSNKQQRVMLAAEQRAKFIGQEFDQAFQARVMNATKVSEIANMNFTAEQQVALENSRIVNTIGLANLNNRQAMTMAEAGALANLDMSNLSNRQQAAVQNAQSFLQMDMANLSNLQQTNMFKGQQRVQSLFTDQAASNAAKQFNATSENQTDQFFANLTTQTSQFNAAQANAQNQYNSGQANAMTQFNQEVRNQRDQFNATNRLVIDQANVQWRRQVATADTAAVNRANELNASSLLGISNTAMNNLWTHYSDNMEFAWKSTDNERERLVALAIKQMEVEGDASAAAAASSGANAAAFGKLISNLFLGNFL